MSSTHRPGSPPLRKCSLQWNLQKCDTCHTAPERTSKTKGVGEGHPKANVDRTVQEIHWPVQIQKGFTENISSHLLHEGFATSFARTADLIDRVDRVDRNVLHGSRTAHSKWPSMNHWHSNSCLTLLRICHTIRRWIIAHSASFCLVFHVYMGCTKNYQHEVVATGWNTSVNCTFELRLQIYSIQIGPNLTIPFLVSETWLEHVRLLPTWNEHVPCISLRWQVCLTGQRVTVYPSAPGEVCKTSVTFAKVLVKVIDRLASKSSTWKSWKLSKSCRL